MEDEVTSSSAARGRAAWQWCCVVTLIVGGASPGRAASLTLVGGLSTYHPGDGHNSGRLACGGLFTAEQHHVAIRQWRGRCGVRALVCSAQTLRCTWTVVMDSGPWGAVPIEQGYVGSGEAGRRAGRGKPAKRWEVQIRLKPGWRRRGVADLTLPVWRALGKPRFLSKVIVWVP